MCGALERSGTSTEAINTVQRTIALLMPETLIDLARVDTDTPPELPKLAAAPERGDEDMPDLPKSCRLTADEERQASQVGVFEREYVAWAAAVANQTPIAYQRAIATLLIAVAIGRRVYVPAKWGQEVFPNQYVIILGTTTYHRKSTALNLMRSVVEEAFPHLLMPRPGSAENFGNALAGKWETDNLPPEDKAELERARVYAGQRLILRDELSGLFRSFGRDHMAGFKEDLLEMYDAPRSHRLSTNSKGIVIARDIAPCLIGASTPAGMSTAVSAQDWEDGNLARFLLITPEPDYADRSPVNDHLPNDYFVHALRGLHERLPTPAQASAAGERGRSEAWGILPERGVWERIVAYADALREMTNPRRADALDNRLRGTYGRHHVKALKVAISLSVMDWYQQQNEPKPTLTAAHWFRAQQIAEDWRASAHRFLSAMTVSEDAEHQSRVLNHLRRYPEGETKTELLERTHLRRQQLEEALSGLIESGQVQVFKRKNQRGPEATVYQAV